MRILRPVLATAAVAAPLVLIAACGSSSNSGSASTSSAGTSTPASTSVSVSASAGAGEPASCRKLAADVKDLQNLDTVTDATQLKTRLDATEKTLTADAAQGPQSVRSAVATFDKSLDKLAADAAAKDASAVRTDEQGLASSVVTLGKACDSATTQ